MATRYFRPLLRSRLARDRNSELPNAGLVLISFRKSLRLIDSRFESIAADAVAARGD